MDQPGISYEPKPAHGKHNADMVPISELSLTALPRVVHLLYSLVNFAHPLCAC